MVEGKLQRGGRQVLAKVDDAVVQRGVGGADDALARSAVVVDVGGVVCDGAEICMCVVSC
jgi:hypothetical protein